MPELNQRSKVTVEDLLRLKRTERPDAEFWTKFERELRQKQLTALMEKRPWWQELPQFFSRRAYLPVGATAILAFTLVSVKYYAPTQLAQGEVSPVAAPAPAAREVAAPAEMVSSPLVNRSDVAVVAEQDDVAVAANTVAQTNSEPVELMPLLVPAPSADRPSDRLLAANLARSDSADTDFRGSLGVRLSPPEQATAPAVDELASIPTSSRRNRLLARYEGRQVNPEPALPDAVRQKLVRRLGDSDSDRGTRLAREIDSFSTPMPQIVALRF